MEQKKYKITRIAPSGGMNTEGTIEERVISVFEGYPVPQGAVEVSQDTPTTEWAQVKAKEKK